MYDGALTLSSVHPWSSYAVFLTTFTHWALVWDLGLWFFCPDSPWALWILAATMLASKIIKLFPLFVREPLYVLFAPFSALFGYFHGAIKLYAAMTLHVVCQLDRSHDWVTEAQVADVKLKPADLAFHRRPGVVEKAPMRTTRTE